MTRAYSKAVDGEKACGKCGLTKPVSEFYVRPARNGGLTSACRDCIKAQNKRAKTSPTEVACVHCGERFLAKQPSRAKYCSSQCSTRSHTIGIGGTPRQPLIVEGRKRCNGCDQWKTVADYNPRNSRGGAPMSRCKTCVAAKVRAYSASDRGRNRRYAIKYGVTVDWYEAKLREQDGRCAICLEVPERRLVIDHCHVTGKARGLLCFLCNSALGRFEDNADRLRRAIVYLDV